MLIEQKVLIACVLAYSVFAYINRRELILFLPSVFAIICFSVFFVLYVIDPPNGSVSSSQLDRFSDTYCTSKRLHFATSNDSVADRLVEDKKRLVVRCVDSQDRVIEFRPTAPMIPPLRLRQ